jgi:hypothetical protein
MGVKGITGTCPSIPAKGVATRGPLGRGTGVRWGTVFPDKSIVRTAAMIFITVIKGTPVVMGVSLGTDQCKFYQEYDSVDFWVNKNHNIFYILLTPGKVPLVLTYYKILKSSTVFLVPLYQP